MFVDPSLRLSKNAETPFDRLSVSGPCDKLRVSGLGFEMDYLPLMLSLSKHQAEWRKSTVSTGGGDY